MKSQFEALWKNYKTVEEQVIYMDIAPEQNQNILKLIDYERNSLMLVKGIEEIVFAYPDEPDCGIYIVLGDGQILAVNNMRAIKGYLSRNRLFLNSRIILAHKLGDVLDFERKDNISQPKSRGFRIDPYFSSPDLA